MSTEAKQTSRQRPRRNLLDVVAFAGVESLQADQVLVALGDAHSWGVRGSADGRARPANGGNVVATGQFPAGVVLPVTLTQVEDRSWLLKPQSDAADLEPAPEVLQYAVVGDLFSGRRIMVVADGPRADPAVGLADCMRRLLEAAEDALAFELEGEQLRLRIALQEREEERRRWARELHDDTLQHLGALQLLLSSARRRWDRTPQHNADELLGAVDQATELLVDQITSLRHLITELRPAALDELGLRAPVQALAERTETLTGLHVEVQMSLRYSDGMVSTRLLPDIEIAIYRVVQEALTNAGRHSGASWARVSVIEGNDEVQVEVCDNGRGLGRGSAGFGIQGMRERAALAGGRLQVSAAPNGTPHVGDGAGGTLVRLVVPAAHRSETGG